MVRARTNFNAAPQVLPIYREYPPEYEQFNTQFKGKIETIGWMLWDTALYTSAATLALRLFNVRRATIDLSNMELASQLPAQQAFLIRAIRFFVKQRPRVEARAATTNVTVGAISNIQLLMNTGTMALTVGSKTYAQFPLWMITSGAGAYGQAGLDGNTADPGLVSDWGIAGTPHSQNVFTLTKPIFIPPQMNFFLDLLWPAALTISGGNTNLTVGFDGELLRAVQ